MRRYCPNCGESILPDAKKCPHCEEDFEFESKLGLVKDKIKKWKQEGYEVDELGKMVDSHEKQKLKTKRDEEKTKKTILHGTPLKIAVGTICIIIIVSMVGVYKLIPENNIIPENSIVPENGIIPENNETEMVLIFGCSGDAHRLDPADVTDGESIQRMDNIF